MLTLIFEAAQLYYLYGVCNVTLSSALSLLTVVLMFVYAMFASSAIFKLCIVIIAFYAKGLSDVGSIPMCMPSMEVLVYCILLAYGTIVLVFAHQALLELLIDREKDPDCGQCKNPVDLRKHASYSYFPCCLKVFHNAECNRFAPSDRCPNCIVACQQCSLQFDSYTPIKWHQNCKGWYHATCFKDEECPNCDRKPEPTPSLPVQLPQISIPSIPQEFACCKCNNPIKPTQRTYRPSDCRQCVPNFSNKLIHYSCWQELCVHINVEVRKAIRYDFSSKQQRSTLELNRQYVQPQSNLLQRKRSGTASTVQPRKK